MTEPHSTIAGALAGAAVSPVGLFLGAQVDALVIGLVAAVFVSIWLEQIDNRLKAASAVLFSALLAGYGSPVAAGWVATNVTSLASGADGLRMLLALLIGAAAPRLVPLCFKFLGKKLDGDLS
jgi:hypothetical protein